MSTMIQGFSVTIWRTKSRSFGNEVMRLPRNRHRMNGGLRHRVSKSEARKQDRCSSTGNRGLLVKLLTNSMSRRP